MIKLVSSYNLLIESWSFNKLAKIKSQNTRSDKMVSKYYVFAF